MLLRKKLLPLRKTSNFRKSGVPRRGTPFLFLRRDMTESRVFPLYKRNIIVYNEKKETDDGMNMDYIALAGREHCCSFSGHRRLARERYPVLAGKVSETVRWLYYEKDVRVFLTGAAIGFDTVAAIAVLNLKRELKDLHLAAVIPCPEQGQGWTEAQRGQYRTVLSGADQVIEIADSYYKGCMLERNRFLVENAAYLISYYDGSGKGGTAYTVNYAAQKGLTVLPLYEERT